MKIEWEKLSVSEFIEDDRLLPSDTINWPQDSKGRLAKSLPGWTFQSALGGETLHKDVVVADIFIEDNGSGHILIDILALGVPCTVLCRTQTAFLRFARDWLRPLMELNRTSRIPETTDASNDQANVRPISKVLKM
jgi:hypothetical protein